MSVDSSASATWVGDLATGQGTVRPASGAFAELTMTSARRFQSRVAGTSPEELIAAAHAGCFSMALSGQLGEAGLVAQSIQTKATVTIEKSGGGFTITAVHLDLTARIPGASLQAFETAAENAKSGCPVSKVLNATITLDKRLES